MLSSNYTSSLSEHMIYTSDQRETVVTDAFQYKPLKDGQIRLIQIFPSSDEERITCQLLYTTLDDRLEYQALSYTWGNPTPCEAISINGSNFSIAKNLYETMKHLRPKTGYETFWIDAICIDQSSVAERNNEVLRMKEIYSRAQRVIIWLGRDIEPQDHKLNYGMFEMWNTNAFGDGDRSTRMAFDLLRTLSSALHSSVSALDDAKAKASGHNVPIIETVRSHLSQHEDIYVSLHRKLTPQEEEPWLALGRLCWRPWFRRVWVLQEVSLAKTAAIACGNQRIPWTTFQEALKILEIHSYSQGASDIVGRMLGASIAFKMNIGRDYRDGAYGTSGPGHELLALLNHTRHLEATDPRDKIYGLMGLAAVGAEREGMRPDYGKSVVHAYKGLVKFVLGTSRHMEILCFCDGSAQFPDLPSWAPDWTHFIPRLTFDLGKADTSHDVYYTARYTSSMYKFSEDLTTMTVGGFQIGSISYLSKVQDISPDQDDSPNLQATLDDWESAVGRKVPESPYKDRHVALQKLLSAEDGPGHELRTRNAGSHPEDAPRLYNELRSGQDRSDSKFTDCSAQLKRYITGILTWTHGCNLFHTDSGYIGLAVADHRASKGDLICIILGVQMPLIIRKVGEHHFLVGRCYVQGLMGGQAMESFDDHDIEYFNLK